MRIVIDVLIIISLFFAFAGTVGLLRMPDFFCRMHSSTNIATLGILGVVIAGILYALIYLGDGSMAVKLGIIGLFNILANPIASHALANGAYKHAKKPIETVEADQYGEDLVEKNE
ncbi:MAG: monovalent cation/H(+) antiporter subunit G [Lachnospiraceae bacterium]|nr:monovalent cation/H(+) antiporter subunit G [Lachnospiraceae bacterium]